MTSDWVAIQRNPRSGAGPRAAVIRELIRELRRHGLRPRLFSKRERLDAAVADDAQRANLRCIVAAGGDGTIVDVVNRHPGVPVAVLPMGTENLFAKYLKIPRSGRFVAEMIAAGQTKTLDLCRLGEKRFAIMASFGFDAEVVRRTHERRSGHIRKTSYLQPIWRTLRTYSYPELRLYLDDNPTPVRGRLAIVVNLPAYAMQLPIAKSALGDDGILDVRVFQRGSAFQMMRYCYKVFRGKHEQLEDVLSLRASEIRIESDEPVPIQIDGDPGGFTPAVIRAEPATLTMFVPHAI